MKTSLLEQAMAPEALNQAWRRLKTEHTPWSPAIGREELQHNLMRHLLECRAQVLDDDYRPLPLRQFPLPKPDGRIRVITAQYLKDKLVQRAILTVLEPRAERLFHDDSYAYRPGRNVEQALAKVRERVRIGQDWLVDADIEKFFDSIPHRPLLKMLDDFLLFAPVPEQAEKAREFAARQLERLGLTIHPEKTRVVRSSPDVTFLGERLPSPAGTPPKARP